MCFNTPTLRDKATLVKLARRMFNPTLMDKTVTTAVDSTHGTTHAGKYMKRRLQKCVELKETQTAFGEVYQFVRDNTLPWMDEGMRLVSNEHYAEFLLRYRELADHAMDCVQKLAAVWDAAVAADQAVLKGMWDPNDYPTKEEMVAQWSLKLMPMPIPSSEDFRVDLDETDKALLDQQLAEVEANATTHVLKELLTPVKAMAERLSVAKGEPGSTFRNTLVSNVEDACERAKRLNINHDSRIDEVVDEMSALIKGVTPDDLREDVALRASVGGAMSELEKKMASWF